MDELSWMGGIFDGEGCVGLYVMAAGYKFPVVRLVVNASNTDRRALEPFRERFGGNINYSCKPPKAHHKQVYRWAIVGARAHNFLMVIRPYSRIKVEQIDLAIRFWELPWRASRGTTSGQVGAGQNRERAETERTIDLDMARQIKALKRA